MAKKPWHKGEMDSTFPDAVVIIYAGLKCKSCDGTTETFISDNKCVFFPAVEANDFEMELDCNRKRKPGRPPHQIP